MAYSLVLQLRTKYNVPLVVTKKDMTQENMRMHECMYDDILALAKCITGNNTIRALLDAHDRFIRKCEERKGNHLIAMF